jgi:ribosomal protein S3AE
MAKNATKKESASETVRTSDGQVLMLTVECEPVQRVAREKYPSLRDQMRAHLAKMAEMAHA